MLLMFLLIVYTLVACGFTTAATSDKTYGRNVLVCTLGALVWPAFVGCMIFSWTKKQINAGVP